MLQVTWTERHSKFYSNFDITLYRYHVYSSIVYHDVYRYVQFLELLVSVVVPLRREGCKLAPCLHPLQSTHLTWVFNFLWWAGSACRTPSCCRGRSCWSPPRSAGAAIAVSPMHHLSAGFHRLCWSRCFITGWAADLMLVKEAWPTGSLSVSSYVTSLAMILDSFL